MNPIKTLMVLGLVTGLSACGGGRPSVSTSGTSSQSFATGPVYNACLRAERRSASRSLCGCVQASANSVLTVSEQNRATRFFRDPHSAQVTRQSDNPRDERFWKRYKEFVATAERRCA